MSKSSVERTILKALALTVGIALMLSSVAQGSSDGLPTARPSALTVDGEISGCDSVKTNRNYESIVSDLDLFDSTIDMFFLEGICVVNVLNLRYAPAVHVLLQDPTARIMVLTKLIAYSDRALVPRILNRRDENNRTALDYLEFLREGAFANNNSARESFVKMRKMMCRFGGVHTIPRADCVAKD